MQLIKVFLQIHQYFVKFNCFPYENKFGFIKENLSMNV